MGCMGRRKCGDTCDERGGWGVCGHGMGWVIIISYRGVRKPLCTICVLQE